MVTDPGLVPDMPFDTYLADPVPGGSLSSTFARLLTRHVPAKAKAVRDNNKTTRAMNLGTAAHLLALGSGPELIVWEHDGRTGLGKAERAAAAGLLESGAAVAVKPDEHERVTGMVAALQADAEVRRILDTSQSELSGFWREGDVWCRARYDLLSDEAAYDYKTAKNVTRRGFSRAMADFGYHQQADFYGRGLHALGHPAADNPMRFICQETEPPYLIQIHQPDEEAREVARVLNDRALGIYAASKASGEWPGYPTLDAEPAGLPAYYFFENDEALPDMWRPLDIEIGA